MSYLVLARKWRPSTFDELVGQSHVVRALSYALDNDLVHHAYLFTGTRGVGKTSIARIFAKSLNCQKEGVSSNPCGKCDHCIDIEKGKFVDLIEVDAASRTGVDETRDLIESVSYLPAKGRYKVYLIDEVHMFSKSSFNALLKTLEEPPEYVKFILATTDPEKLPITVLSRCLQFNLKSLSVKQIRSHLLSICKKESIRYDDKSLDLLAESGRGSLRDTLSVMDQALAYGQGQLLLESVVDILGTINPTDVESCLLAVLSHDANALYKQIKKFEDYEVDSRSFLLMLLKLLQLSAWEKEDIKTELSQDLCLALQGLPAALIQLWYDIVNKGLEELQNTFDEKRSLEMILIRLLVFRPEEGLIDKSILEKSNTTNKLETEKNFIEAKTVEKSDSLENAEASFFQDENTTNNTVNVDNKLPELEAVNIDADKELQESWHLSVDEVSTEETNFSDIAINTFVQKASDLLTSDQVDIDVENTKEVDQVIDNKKILTDEPPEIDLNLHQETETKIIDSPLIQNTDQWFDLLAKLDLTTFTRQFASTGILSLANNKATLTIAPLNEVLKTKESVAELEKALQIQFNSQIKLDVTLGDVSDTPIERKENQAAEEKEIMLDAFNHNIVVKKLKDKLSAKVIDTTVKPI